MKTSARETCTCSSCVSCCENKPGWFKPGEAEKVAAFLNIPLEELFRDYLAVDWWEEANAERDTFVLSPAIVGESAGREMPGNPIGVCVFLKRRRCSIHAVKPFECAAAWCGDGAEAYHAGPHEQAADAWRAPEHQAQIAALLGREAEARPYSILDALFGRIA